MMVPHELLDEVRRRYPSAEIASRFSPIGRMVIHVRLSGKFVVIEYLEGEFGVSLLTDQSVPFTGHDYVSSSMNAALAEADALLGL